MLRVFIGYDPRESVAASVLAYSIHTRSSVPVSITFLDKSQIPQYSRPEDPLASTAFTYSRFLVPWLCNFQGKAIFMDCDMLCLGDMAGFLSYPQEGKAVSVVKHNYTPKSDTKFLNSKQTAYPRKLWSALMVFDNEKCKALTPEYVNTATGAELHQFKWLPDERIGEIPECWQWIPNHSPGSPKIIHWTEGGPWFGVGDDYQFGIGHTDSHAKLWFEEVYRMGNGRLSFI